MLTEGTYVTRDFLIMFIVFIDDLVASLIRAP